MRPVVVLACCATLSCAKPASEGLHTEAAVALYDRERFACDALPVLVRHCSYLACHGDPQHAFRLYSPGKLRLGDVATRAGRDAPLTAAELEANFESAVGVLRAAPTGTIDLQKAPLLQKPLRADFGGSQHQGVGIFPRPPAQSLDEDPSWTALVTWVAGTPAGPRTPACTALLAAIEVTP